MKALTGLVIGAFAVTAISATTPALADGHGKKLMKQIEMNSLYKGLKDQNEVLNEGDAYSIESLVNQ